MTHLTTLSFGLCLCATATACLGAGSISEASDADTRLLKLDARSDGPPFQYYLLADNQVTHTSRHRGPLRERGSRVIMRDPPGIISIWSWPSGPSWFTIGGSTGAIGGIAGEFQLWSHGEQLPIELDRSATQWRPDRIHTEYAIPGGRIEQDLCITDDTVVCKLKLSGAPEGAQVRIVGEPTGESGADEPVIRDGKIILRNRGSLTDVWQVVAAPGEAVFLDPPPNEVVLNARGEAMDDAKRYQFRFAAQPQIVIAATLSRDRQRAIARVGKALDDPDGAFGRAKERWADFFSLQIPTFDCSDESLTELYYWIAYVLEVDAYRNIDEPTWPYAYVVPSKWEWRGIWPEDLSHCLTGLRWFNDPALAEDCLRTVHFRGRQKLTLVRIEDHAYGLTTIATWALFLRTGNIEFLRELFPVLCKMNRFEHNVRDDDKDGLTSMGYSYTLGWDNSLRFAYGENAADHREFRRLLEPTDCNAYYLRQSQILARSR